MSELQFYRQVTCLSKHADPAQAFEELARSLVRVTESWVATIELPEVGTWAACSEVETRFDAGQVLVVPAEGLGTITLRGRSAGYAAHERDLVECLAAQLVLVAPALPRVLPLDRAMRLYRRRHIAALLHRLDWNVARVARELRVSRSHLYDLMAELEIRRVA
jgi:DNA-binding NtrC family response regulator